MNIRVVAMGLFAALLMVRGAAGDEAEDRAVAAIEELGGTIKRDAKKPGRPVINVILRNTKVTDAGLKELAAFKQLDYLCLDNTQVTDTGLKELAPLKQLVVLDLLNTKVTDAGMKELAALKKLKELYVTFSTGGPGVRKLCKALPKLTINLDYKNGRDR